MAAGESYMSNSISSNTKTESAPSPHRSALRSPETAPDAAAPLLIGYCTNVHPSETLEELEGTLRGDIPSVRSALTREEGLTFGLGLRIGASLLRALSAPAEERRFARLLEAQGYSLFSVNGFPYGDFHASSVKERVYEPDWTDQKRLTYTIALAELIARLPGPRRRTISTVAGGFRPATETFERRQRIAEQLDAAARALAEIERRSGVEISLCLEPEPETTLERSDETVDFFQRQLYPRGAHMRRYLALCYDCCHQAVLFERPEESLKLLTEAEIRIGKVQVSSALHLDAPHDPHARAALLAFDEPRYLHQTAAQQADGTLLRALDLDGLRAPPPEWLAVDAWRTHFHVPIWWEGEGYLRTTAEDWRAAVRWLAARDLCEQYEVETYSWGVIPAAHRRSLGGLHGAIAQELRVLSACLQSARKESHPVHSSPSSDSSEPPS